MMPYSIIEDCSPYYIRFTFPDLSNVINFISMQSSDIERTKKHIGYTHEYFSIDIADKILALLPMSEQFDFQNTRTSIFHTPAKGGCGIHKDGDHRISLNIPIVVLDDHCETCWYDDDTCSGAVEVGMPYARNISLNFYDRSKFIPSKTMVAKSNEVILFNTTIYHSWHNITSTNIRRILTLRATDAENIYFNDAKKLLFS